jgi:ATP-dependent protease ClpP protease subunit
MLASQLGIAVDDRVKPVKGYEVKNLADGSAEIAIYDEIGPWGVSAVRFTDELRTINARTITLRIASPGGDVADGLAILNALRAHPATVNVVVEGWAASAASFIAMAGDRVEMAPNSMLMIHDAMTVCVGNAEEMLETAALLDKHSDNIADVYQRKAGGTVAEWRQRMRDTTWYTAQEAVDAGLADGILGEGAGAGPGEMPEEASPAEKKAAVPATASVSTQVSADVETPPVVAASTAPETEPVSADEAEEPAPSVVMTTTDLLASWDFAAISEAIKTAAKEASPHG